MEQKFSDIVFNYFNTTQHNNIDILFFSEFVYKFVFLQFPKAQQFTLGNLVQITWPVPDYLGKISKLYAGVLGNLKKKKKNHSKTNSVTI